MPPIVSVRVVTYNHEKFIAQCLEGILMQRTNFPFEVVVGEDCSTDHTREIVLDYGRKYPQILQIITSEHNIGGMQNSIRVHKASSGKYHALCEGDDYWINPLKLQKQVDFMESHPGCSMCFHDTIITRDDKNAMPRYYCQAGLPERLSIEDLCRLNLAIPTASMLARSDVLAKLPTWRKDISYGDLLFRLWCAHKGYLGYLPDVMSIYRIHPGGMLMSNKYMGKHYAEIINIYQRFDAETAHQYSNVINQTILKLEEEYRFERLKKKVGRFYIFLRPDKAIERLQEYLDIKKQYSNLYRR